MGSRQDAVLTLALLATILVWGSAFTGIKVLVQYMDPAEVAVFRFLFGAVPFLGLWIAKRRAWRRPRPMGARGALRILFLGALAVPAYHVTLNWGEQMLTTTASHDVAAGVSALLVATTPGLTFLLAVPALGERATPRRFAGLLVALVGVALLVLWGRGVPTEPAAIRGGLVVLLAPASWAVYSILIKKELRNLGPLELTTYSLLAGTVLLAPFSLRGIWDAAPNLPLEAWVWGVWLGVAATFGGYVVWNVALQHWDATRVSTFVYLAPLAAVAWAVLLVDERVTWAMVLGGALILFGVWLASGRRGAATSAASTGPPPPPEPPTPGRPKRGP